MPLRRGRAKAGPTSDPLTACLDANGTYICTSFNPRCFIIQKVTTTPLVPTNDLESSDYKDEGGANLSTSWTTNNQSYEYFEYNPSLLDGE
ncbi:hypothetical protein WA026_018484 [Henosepilachna vigintioctopunctata]|uniref:Uncharacterized protein n=1 Tax=Henosepilachna vigintioctopunctata TaxID=420089 RepID=A0AAW1UUL2_9CUCU